MISFNSVARFQGGRHLFQDASFQIGPKDRIGLVGPNGSGKTTIFRLIVGESQPDAGSISIPDRLIVGYFSQEPAGVEEVSVLEATMAGCQKVRDLEIEIDTLSNKLGDPDLDPNDMDRILDRLGTAQTQFEAAGGYDFPQRAETILCGLGFSLEDLEKGISTISGGWRMRIELAKVLLLKPDVLVMDEPTNHLDVESIIWLEEFLERYDGAIIMTSHDRDFMNRIVKKIAAVEMGTVNIYSGNYDFYDKESQIRLNNLEAAADRQAAMLRKEEEFIARFKARASHAAQVQSRVKMIEKMERIEIPKTAKSVDFRWPQCPRSGDTVVDLKGVNKAYGDKTILKGSTFHVGRKERVAVLGVNGAGKSTLLKIVADKLEPDGGSCKLGANLHVGYFAQHQTEILSPTMTVFEAVQEVAPMSGRGPLMNILGSLLFSGDDAEKQIKVLSGGEKTRVVLARLIAKPVNFLILDEPTNHLDMTTREILLTALGKFEGTLLFVSHDRHFLRELASRVVLIDHGETTNYLGGLPEFLEKQDGHFPGSDYTVRIG